MAEILNCEEQQSQMVFDSDEELNDALNMPDSALSGEALSSETRPPSRRVSPTSSLTVVPQQSQAGPSQAQPGISNPPSKKRKINSVKTSAGKKDMEDPSVSFLFYF